MITMIKKLRAISGEYSKSVTLMILCNVAKAVFNGVSLAGVSFLIYRIAFPNTIRITDVVMLTCIMVISVAGKIVSSYYASRHKNLAAYGIGAKSRLRIGDRLKELNMGYFNDNSLGTVAGGLTTVISNLENTGFYIIEHTISGVLQAVIMMLCIFIFDWQTGFIAFAGLIVSVLINQISKSKIDKLTRGLQDCRLGLDSAMLEFVQGMGVIKAFGKAQQAFSKIKNSISKNHQESYAIEKVLAPVQSFYIISLKLFSCFIMLFSVYRFYNHSISLAVAMIMIILSFSCFSSVEMVGMMQNVQGIALQSLETIDQMQNLEPLSQGTRKTFDTGKIDMEQVRFSYAEGVPVIRDITAQFAPGKTTAIVGPSGCGKSTLCYLIARFWDIDSGQILIDGTDVGEYDYDNLLEQISIIFQDVYLFEDTVRNNICFGKPDATDEQMINVAKKACCHDFIMQLPQGYDTVLQEGGVSLSGGERQRISIARAMLKDAGIVIMDEATASVDPENEQKLTQALNELVKGKTAIIIAHRLNTVQAADHILVMEEGSIIQQGTHEQLIAMSGLYREFVTIRNNALEWEFV
ncbi:MAG: ABC transporter ATP-binding protein [Lachnospiraceae bacterium]